MKGIPLNITDIIAVPLNAPRVTEQQTNHRKASIASITLFGEDTARNSLQQPKNLAFMNIFSSRQQKR